MYHIRRFIIIITTMCIEFGPNPVFFNWMLVFLIKALLRDIVHVIM